MSDGLISYLGTLVALSSVTGFALMVDCWPVYSLGMLLLSGVTFFESFSIVSPVGEDDEPPANA